MQQNQKQRFTLPAYLYVCMGVLKQTVYSSSLLAGQRVELGVSTYKTEENYRLIFENTQFEIYN